MKAKLKLKRMLELVEAGEKDLCKKCCINCKRYTIVEWINSNVGISSLFNLNFCSDWEEEKEVEVL